MSVVTDPQPAEICINAKLGETEISEQVEVNPGMPTGTSEELYFTDVIKAVKSVASLKHNVLQDKSGSHKWLEVTPSTCYLDKSLGPVNVVRLLVSSIKAYKVQVLYPIPRCVERLKG